MVRVHKPKGWEQLHIEYSPGPCVAQSLDHEVHTVHDKKPQRQHCSPDAQQAPPNEKLDQGRP